MRLPGWCARCYRIRTVTVRVPMPCGVPVGICDECEEKRR